MKKVTINKLFGALLALIVAAIVFFAGPANAVLINMPDNSIAKVGDTFSFDIDIDLQDSSMIINSGNLIIGFDDGSARDWISCDIKNGYSCTRDKNGKITTYNNVKITATGDVRFGYGYGYGYGYQTGKVKYHVEWQVTDDARDGKYLVRLTLNTNKGKYDKEGEIAVLRSSGSSTGSSSGGSTSFSIFDVGNLNGLTLDVEENSVINFELNGEKHTLEINNVYGNYVAMTFYSEPVDVNVYLAEVKAVDIDNDGKFDLTVHVNNIQDNNAVITLEHINRPDLLKVTGSNLVGDEAILKVLDTNKENNAITGASTATVAKQRLEENQVISALMALIVVLIGLIFLMIFGRKN